MSLQLIEVKKNENNAKIIWQWRNDSETRNNSLRTKIIPWNTFYLDFNNKYFSNSIPPLFVIENNIKIGFVGLVDSDVDTVIIGININPDYRKQGYGEKTLKLVIDYLKDTSIKKINATIKEHNIGSIKIFERNDFKLCKKINNLIYYQKIIN